MKLESLHRDAALPDDLLILIMQIAASHSIKTAITLTDVSRLARDVALRILHSVVVVRAKEQPIVPNTSVQHRVMYLFHIANDDSDTTVHRLEVDNLTRIFLRNANAIDSDVVEWVKSQAESDHISLVESDSSSLSMPDNMLTAFWYDNRNNGPLSSTSLLLALVNQQLSLRSLALEADSLPFFEHQRVFQPTHLKFLDGKGDWRTNAFCGAVRSAPEHTDMFSSVTHLEFGMIDPDHYFKAETDLFASFPALTHLAFSFFVTDATLEWSTDMVRAMLKHKQAPALQALALVIRDKGELRIHPREDPDDGTDQRAAVEAVVKTVDDPRLIISVRPGPEWKDWQRLSRRGESIWSVGNRSDTTSV